MSALFNLIGVHLAELHFKLLATPKDKASGKTTIGIAFNLIREGEESTRFTEHLKVRVESENYEMTVDFLGYFEAQTTQFDEDKFNKLAAAICYPYIRPIITSTTASAAVEPLLPPVVAFASFKKNKVKLTLTREHPEETESEVLQVTNNARHTDGRDSPTSDDND
jgi:preprotein translocase subunit SecB